MNPWLFKEMQPSLAPSSGRFDVAIAGGGMVGATLAVALAQAGLRIALIEHTPFALQQEPAFDGRVSAIALSSKHLFTHLGVWEAMQAQAEPILDIRVSDGASSVFLHYDHNEVGEEPFGWIVENRTIRIALHEAVMREAAQITVLSPNAFAGYAADAGGVTVMLTDGAEIRASLLVGADSKHSKVRKAAGIGALEAGYSQSAIVCTIAHTLPHLGLAQERFLPVGPFAVLPMTNNRSSLVWTERHADIPMFKSLSDVELAQEIHERVGDYLGEITVAGPRFFYPLSVMHATSYIADRVALIGDAAHAIHPIAGQGVNLGFRDVAVLAELLGKRASLGLDIGARDVLSHYQRWRRLDNITMLAVTDGLTRLFSTDALPFAAGRRAGLALVGKLPPVKRFFMKHAMGLVGDVPKLLKAA